VANMAIQIGSVSTFPLAPFVGAKGQPQQEIETFKQSILAAVRQDNATEADHLEQKLADAKQAVEQLGVMSKGMAKSHKADAAEKVKRIKAEIQAMRMAGGDPKVVARRIAQLARELASAAHEYASAAGGGTQASTDSGSPSQAATGGTTAGAQPMAIADAVDADTAPTSDNTENDEQYSSTEEEPQSPDEAKAQFMAGLQRRLGEMNEIAEEARADQEFAQEVRMLAAQLKALAKQQEAKLRQRNEQLDSASDLAPAMAEIEKAVAQIVRGSAPVLPVIDVIV
jgi:hypothetical protein